MGGGGMRGKHTAGWGMNTHLFSAVYGPKNSLATTYNPHPIHQSWSAPSQPAGQATRAR